MVTEVIHGCRFRTIAATAASIKTRHAKKAPQPCSCPLQHSRLAIQLLLQIALVDAARLNTLKKGQQKHGSMGKL